MNPPAPAQKHKSETEGSTPPKNDLMKFLKIGIFCAALLFGVYGLTLIGGYNACKSDVEALNIQHQYDATSIQKLQAKYDETNIQYQILQNTHSKTLSELQTASNSLANCNNYLSSCQSDLGICKSDLSKYKTTTISNSQYGFSLEIPSGWQEQKDAKFLDGSSVPLKVYKSYKSEIFDSSVHVYRSDSTYSGTLEDAYTSNFNYYSQNSNYTLYKHGRVTLNNMPGYAFVFSIKRPDSYNLKLFLITVKNGDYLWHIRYDADVSNFDSDALVADEISKTIRFDSVSNQCPQTQSGGSQQAATSASSSDGLQSLYWGISILKLLFGG